MDQSKLIQAINKQKQEVQVSITLKQKSQDFSQLLFNALFDQNTEAEKALIELEALFLKIRNPITTIPTGIDKNNPLLDKVHCKIRL